MEREKGQLTLFDCRKVVSSNNTWGMFAESEIVQHKETLLRPESSMHLLLNTLRKLDCYRLQLTDLSGTEIGRAAATLAAHHPRQATIGPCMLFSLAAVPVRRCSRACCPH
jgi:hypothetical protein